MSLRGLPPLRRRAAFGDVCAQASWCSGGGCLRGIASGIAAQFLLRGVSASDDARLRALYGAPGVCGSDRASASGAAWGCEPYGGFGGVPSPWSEPSDATPLAALVAGDICGQRILAGTPGTLPAGCRGVGGSRAPCWRGSAEAGCWVERSGRCCSFGMASCSRFSRAALRGTGTRRRCISHDQRGWTAGSCKEECETAKRKLIALTRIRRPGGASAEVLLTGRWARLRRPLELFPAESSRG